jgi:hypothetical protein
VGDQNGVPWYVLEGSLGKTVIAAAMHAHPEKGRLKSLMRRVSTRRKSAVNLVAVCTTPNAPTRCGDAPIVLLIGAVTNDRRSIPGARKS